MDKRLLNCAGLVFIMLLLSTGVAQAQQDSERPTCKIVQTGKTEAGETFIVIEFQDTGSGLRRPPQGIQRGKFQNVDRLIVNPPQWSQGFKDPVRVTVIKRNEGQPSVIIFTVTDVAGNTRTCDPVAVTVTAGVLDSFGLDQNYPNPFERATTIPFRLSEQVHVELTVYDLRGRKVATLVDEEMNSGTYKAEWNDVLYLPSGTYVYRLKAGTYVETRQLTLVR